MNDKSNCENCVHAEVTTGRTVIMKNGMMIIQQATPGGKNITCKAGTIREISFFGDGMRCSSFKPRGGADGAAGLADPTDPADLANPADRSGGSA